MKKSLKVLMLAVTVSLLALTGCAATATQYDFGLAIHYVDVEFFYVTESGDISSATINTRGTIDDVFERWAELNNVQNVAFIEFYIESPNAVTIEGEFATQHIPGDYFIHHLTLSQEFSAYKEGVHGQLLVEALKNTFYSYSRFDEFNLILAPTTGALAFDLQAVNSEYSNVISRFHFNEGSILRGGFGFSMTSEEGDLVIHIREETIIYFDCGAAAYGRPNMVHDLLPLGVTHMEFLDGRKLDITLGNVDDSFPQQASPISIKVLFEEETPLTPFMLCTEYGIVSWTPTPDWEGWDTPNIEDGHNLRRQANEKTARFNLWGSILPGGGFTMLNEEGDVSIGINDNTPIYFHEPSGVLNPVRSHLQAGETLAEFLDGRELSIIYQEVIDTYPAQILPIRIFVRDELADGEIAVILNGERLRFDVPPQIINGRI